MLKKLSFRASYFLILLIVFHLIGNIIWIKLNNIPPAWDEAVHTKFALEFLHFFQNIFHGKFNAEEFIKPFSDSYGPLVRLVTATILFIFTPSIKLAQFTGTIFFLLTLLIIYFLGKEIFKNDWIGLIAAFVFSFYQVIYDNSRWLLLDIPLTFFVLTTIYFLIKSNFFENKKYTLITFVCLSLTILTKFQGIIYLTIPFGYFVILAVRKNKLNYIKNLVLGILISILFVLPWFIFSFKNLINYYAIAVKPEPFVDPINLVDPTTYFHYLKLFIDYEMTVFIFLVFLITIYFYLKSKSNYKFFILLNIIFYYALFTVFPNKDMRYLFPILPFTALIFAKGFFEFYQRKQDLTSFILSSIVAFNVITYFVLSFGIPFPKGLRAQINLPYIKDIVYLNLTDYPVRKADSRYWPNEEIINDLYRQSKGKPLDIVFIPNFDNFNDNNFWMHLTSYQYKNINIIRAEGRKQFNSSEELDYYLSRFNYFLYTPEAVGVFYQIDKKAFEQIQSAVKKNLNLGNATVLKKWLLPTGEQIYLVKKTAPFN